MAVTYPTFDVDPFADDFIVNPYEHYKEFREAGPVVRLEKYDVLGVARFADVKATMKNHEVFKSSYGPGFNDPFNEQTKGTVAAAEPPDHTEARASIVRRLRLAKLREMQPTSDALAQKLTAEFVERGEFDAATELARPFVSAFVGSMLGISRDIAELAVDASMAGFNSAGALNERTLAAAPVINQLFTMMSKLTRDDFTPGSIGWDILDAHERGELPFASSLSLIFNFLGPAFDTTINAVGNVVWLLATHPDQWDLLRGDPKLITDAIDESLRVESPLQAWSRFCPDGGTVDGVEIPPGTRVAVFPGSANRDERHYADPERFDIRRAPSDHVAFGHGIHMCVGAPLARMELTSVVTALTQLVTTIEPAGEAAIRLNNTTRGLATAPVRVGVTT
jgi:cytochrome P450